MKSSFDHKSSQLLSCEENEQVFRLFTLKCQSLATAIVQLYVTQHPDHTYWVKKETGVMCFIKDNLRRNYFFRLYCLHRSKMIWEQELYNNFEYICSEDYFHMFEVDNCITGLNFASEDEAICMKNIVLEKLTMKRQRREERRNRNSLQDRITPTPQSNQTTGFTFPTNLPTNHKYSAATNHISYSSVPKSGKNKKKRHLTKSDIGLPKDFKHISHVGWDPNKGFDVDLEKVPELKAFFSKAGISDRQLRDKDTREFIYDFINTHGGLDAVKSEVDTGSKQRNAPTIPKSGSLQTPPPVPARTPINRSAPPPPPNKTKPPPLVRGQPPPRPNFTQREPPPMCNAPLPPPPPPVNDFVPAAAPPPPAMVNLPSPVVSRAPDTRSALLESIRAGRNLKPVEVERKPSVGDSRGDLLSAIRQGIELKPVQNNQKPSSTSNCEENSLAEALSNALRARAFAIHSESESDSGNSTDDEDEWEQD